MKSIKIKGITVSGTLKNAVAGKTATSEARHGQHSRTMKSGIVRLNKI